MLKEKKVYFVENSVYTCRGYLCDNESVRNEGIEEGRILYDPAEILTNGMTLYRYRTDRGYTSWFTSVDAAKEANSGIGVDLEDLCYGMLYTDEVQPLPREFKVFFTKSEDGRLSALVNRNPERDGVYTGRRKVFFPSKNWTGAIGVGDAVVTIDNEKANYGFLVGKMVQGEMPESLEQFAEELRTRDFNDLNRRNVLEVDSPIHGHYLAIETKYYERRHGYTSVYDQETLCHEAVAEDVALGHMTSSTPIFEFIGKQLFGVDSPKKLYECLEDAQSWFYKTGRRLNKAFLKDEEYFFDLTYDANVLGDSDEEYEKNMDLLCYAFDQHVLEPIVVGDVPLLKLISAGYLSNGLMVFSPEELDRVEELMRKVNAFGDAELKKLIQRRALVFVS